MNKSPCQVNLARTFVCNPIFSYNQKVDDRQAFMLSRCPYQLFSFFCL
jgi:hypothetical protein